MQAPDAAAEGHRGVGAWMPSGATCISGGVAPLPPLGAAGGRRFAIKQAWQGGGPAGLRWSCLGATVFFCHRGVSLCTSMHMNDHKAGRTTEFARTSW